MTTARPTNKKTVKFKERYVLATGYPWATGMKKPYCEVVMVKSQVGMEAIEIDWPEELWNPNTPKYRLVLERVE